MNTLLSMAVQIGVPVCIESALMLEGTPRSRLLDCWARQGGQVICEQGDLILYRDQGSAAAYAHLCRGIAALAFAPGGVHVFDRLWCSAHYVWGTGQMHVCDVCVCQDKKRRRAAAWPPGRPIIEVPGL